MDVCAREFQRCDATVAFIRRVRRDSARRITRTRVHRRPSGAPEMSKSGGKCMIRLCFRFVQIWPKGRYGRGQLPYISLFACENSHYVCTGTRARAGYFVRETGYGFLICAPRL